MSISWYSLKEHKQEDFDNVFELLESKYIEHYTIINSNNKDFLYKELQEHFKENCLKNIEYVLFKNSPFSTDFSCYLKLFHNKVIIRDNDLTNYDFKILCDIIKSDMLFENDLNKTMMEFNNKQSLLEPTIILKNPWKIEKSFKPWYKTETINRIRWGKPETKKEKVYIKISNIDIKTDFSYLFEFFKPKNLIYLIDDYSSVSNKLRYLQDYISTTHRVQAYSRDNYTKYIIPLHNKIDVFISQLGNNYNNFIMQIQRNKHCFEPNIITTKDFKNTDTQTILSLRHFK